MAQSHISPIQKAVGPTDTAGSAHSARKAEHSAARGGNKEGKPSYDPDAAPPAGSGSVGSPRP